MNRRSTRTERPGRDRHLAPCWFALLLLFACQLVAAISTASDSAIEAFDDPPLVFDLIRTVHKYQTDGTGRTVTEIRARPLNEAGVQALGQIVVPYLESRSSIELRHLRVTKSDGSVLPVDRGKVQRLPAPVAASFPVYSDLHLLHILAPALSPGDIVEYEIATDLSRPDTPGHFGVAHNFEYVSPVVKQTLEIDVPATLEIRLNSPEDFQPTVTEAKDRRLYRWERANTSPAEVDAMADGSAIAPDVELSSFGSWNEVGEWYLGLVKGRTAPNAEIRRLSKELTAASTDDLARMEAIYQHVARNYRYLGLSLGLARYQPQRPSEVVSNGYGDCKDKHTLLAALLEASGFTTFPALISRSRAINEEVPAPHQFNHMITAVEHEGDLIWLDATSQVSPFRYLSADLRDKEALVVGRNGTSSLERTPDAPAFPTIIEMDVDGEVNENGELAATVTYRARGDMEFFTRSLLFANGPAIRTPFAESFLAQTVSRRMELDDFSTGDLTNTEGPLELGFKVRVPNYVKILGESQEVSHYLMEQALPVADEDEPALELGFTWQVNSTFRVRLPDGFEARPPTKSALSASFGSYATRYSTENGVLLAERNITISSPTVDREQYREYAAFRASLEADDGQTFHLRQTEEAKSLRTAGADVEQLLAEGKRALAEKSYDEAAALLSKVVELEEEHPTAWFHFGKALARAGRVEEGVEALERQTEIDPYLKDAFGTLGWALEKTKDFKAAEMAYRSQLEVFPLDDYANRRLGIMLQTQGRCDEALAPLESAISLKENDTRSKTYLGGCLLELGQLESAESVLLELVEESKSVWELTTAGGDADEAELFELALRLFTRATELEPQHEDAFNDLGRTLIELERFEEAVAVLERQIEIVPDHASAYYNLGLTFEALGDPKAAIAAYQGNLELDERVPEASELEGTTQQALESNSNDSLLRHLEVARLVRAKDCAQAIGLLQEILSEDPQSGAAYATLAYCRSNLGQSEASLEAGLKAVALMPDDAGVNALVGMAYLQKGLYGQAIPYLESSKRLAPDEFEGQDVLDYARSQVQD